ncbi:MAG TPA: ATP-binding cassette domain-containing protein, partial [Spirochaetota bacterium]|nr:ATP-binding cassette domain-containing protein [Spirochaetota bacterium]
MIKINNLTFGYTGYNLFDKLNLEIKDGAIYGLLGKNGAGKTTLLKIITGLIYPKSGECLIYEELSSLRLPEILKDLFFIPESFNLPEVSAKQFFELNSTFYDNFNKEVFYYKLNEFEIPENT